MLHVVAAALDGTGVSLESARAFGRLAGRQRVSALAAERDAAACAAGRRVVAALNGDLFEMTTGENEGAQVAAGEVLKAGRTADSPWDAFDNPHAALGVGADGRAWVGRAAFDGVLLGAGGRRAPLDAVNVARGPAAALFTPRWGRRTPRWEARVEAAYLVDGRAGDTLRLRRRAGGAPNGGTRIPPGGVVLSASPGAPAAALLGPGGPAALSAVLRFAPDRGPPLTLMGGWGRLIAAGQVVAEEADSLEGTFPGFSARRHPRSAVGVSRDGRTAWLVAVDGRSAASVGMTFVELAATLRELGAWDALNLDGGGSTTLVADGRVVNRPSDPAGERPVGNALVVTVPSPGRRCGPLPARPRAAGWDVDDADAPRRAPPRVTSPDTGRRPAGDPRPPAS